MATQDIKTVDGRQRLVGYYDVSNAVHILSYKECSVVEAEKDGDKLMTGLGHFVE